MKSRNIKNLDLTVYYEKLSNGLEVYIIPKNNVNNTYATYSTKYGGIDNEFVPLGSKEMLKFPMGIAHFLEHKMFEQEDGSDVFNFFAERGSDANANTNSKKTTYLFSGPNAFYENLEFLLNYVEKPYFTDQNVEKEKGIIKQEIKMYEDKPYSRMYNRILYNTYINNPFKYPTIGTIESVSSITKEDLYNCYKTFYNPSNMFIIVTGNVDPNKTIEIIKKHEDERNINHASEIKLQKYNEPNEVALKSETIEMDVSIPMIAIGYKINVKKFKKVDYDQIYSDIMNAFDLKLCSTSLFNEKLRNDELITDEIGLLGVKSGDHILAIVIAESKYPEKVFNLIDKELENRNIKKEDLERRKKTGISDLVLMSDNIFRINTKIMGDIITKNKVDYDPIATIRNTNIEEVNDILNKISLDNYTVLTINPIDNNK